MIISFWFSVGIALGVVIGYALGVGRVRNLIDEAHKANIDSRENLEKAQRLYELWRGKTSA